MPDARPPPDVEASPAPSVPPPVPDTVPPSVRFRRWSASILVRVRGTGERRHYRRVVRQWNRWVGTSTRQVTDDAYVRGDITPLSAKIEGYVRTVR
jgi:membrane fusion protein (multidrug efflux system)